MITRIHKSLASKRAELHKDDRGFTLIELLVVVLIIGILAAIAIPVFLGQQDQAKDAGVKSDLANAKIAVIAYQADNPSATSVAIDKATLAKYGFTQGPNTQSFSPSTVDPSKEFTIDATSSTNKTFRISSSGGVITVP